MVQQNLIITKCPLIMHYAWKTGLENTENRISNIDQELLASERVREGERKREKKRDRQWLWVLFLGDNTTLRKKKTRTIII